MQIATNLVSPVSRVRPAMFVAVGVCLAAILAALLIVVTGLTTSFATTPFSPRTQDGLIPEGAAVSLDDDHHPAIANLDAGLLQAMRDAAADAAAAGVTFEVTSGWRSAAYQRWLLDSAVETYGSEEVARQFVASPEESAHVTGEAVDIVPVDAQSWLSQHGAQYGLCQVYANEMWHYERIIEPGEVCPQMIPDASAARSDPDSNLGVRTAVVVP
jgi:hypothetical protein